MPYFQIQEELLDTKNMYEALNAHLLEELPALNKMSSEVLVECLAAFVSARKMLSGKITKQYLALMQVIWKLLSKFSFSRPYVSHKFFIPDPKIQIHVWATITSNIREVNFER